MAGRRAAPPSDGGAATVPPGERRGRPSLARPASSGAAAEALLVGALLAAYAVVLLADLSVPQPVDHSRYMDAARTFPSRPSDPIFDHQYLRVGLVAPTALVMRVFGYSEVTYHAFPVVTALLLFGSVYAIGRMLFGRLVGVLSACVLGCAGVVVVAGTELLPDLPATALFTAAVAVLVAVRRGLLARRRLWFAVAGGLLGWSYLTREFIVFVWPLAAVLVWRRSVPSRPARRWEWLWLLAPIALAGAGELALNAALYGDPLKRLHAAAGLGGLPSRPEVAATFHDLPLWVYLGRLPQQLARLPEGPGLLLLLALALAAGLVAAVRAMLSRRRGTTGAPWAGLFAGWILLLWVPLTLLGGVLDPGHPALRLQLLRYWYPVFPALVLGGVAALWVTWPRSRVGRSLVVGIALAIIGLAAVGRPGLPGWVGSPRVSSRALPEFRSWLARSGGRTVWADPKLFRVLPIYFVSPTGHRIWHGHMRRLLTAAQPAPGDYVVAYSVGSDACPRCGDAAKAVVPRVPPAWRTVLISRDRLLRVWRVGI